MARPAGALRQVVLDISTLQPLEQARHLGEDFRVNCRSRADGGRCRLHLGEGKSGGSGSKKTEARPAALGRSRGGLTSKIHLAVNAVGRICRTIVGPGEQSDFKQASALLKGFAPMITMGDKGYDADWFIAELQAAGVIEIVIPSKRNRKEQRPLDTNKYKGRNVVERAINRLKYYRRVATRFDKLARNYEGFVYLAAAALNAKFIL